MPSALSEANSCKSRFAILSLSKVKIMGFDKFNPYAADKTISSKSVLERLLRLLKPKSALTA
jgi:hypothetical protein